MSATPTGTLFCGRIALMRALAASVAARHELHAAEAAQALAAQQDAAEPS